MFKKLSTSLVFRNNFFALNCHLEKQKKMKYLSLNLNSFLYLYRDLFLMQNYFYNLEMVTAIQDF